MAGTKCAAKSKPLKVHVYNAVDSHVDSSSHAHRPVSTPIPHDSYHVQENSVSVSREFIQRSLLLDVLNPDLEGSFQMEDDTELPYSPELANPVSVASAPS